MHLYTVEIQNGLGEWLIACDSFGGSEIFVTRDEAETAAGLHRDRYVDGYSLVRVREFVATEARHTTPALTPPDSIFYIDPSERA
jgi:hypothetical protein